MKENTNRNKLRLLLFNFIYGDFYKYQVNRPAASIELLIIMPPDSKIDSTIIFVYISINKIIIAFKYYFNHLCAPVRSYTVWYNLT